MITKEEYDIREFLRIVTTAVKLDRDHKMSAASYVRDVTLLLKTIDDLKQDLSRIGFL